MTRARDVANIDGILTTTGDTFYASAGATPARLGVGSTGQVLTVASGVPSWATPSVPAFVGCSIYNSASLSPANATDTMLTFDTNDFDTNSFHSTSVNNGRVTIPTGYAGKYLINYAARAVANSTGYRTLTIYKNGTSLVQLMDQVANGSVTSYPTRSIILNLAAGDYLTFYYYQNSGGALTVYARVY